MIDLRNIAALGRGGDTELAFAGPREQEMLRRMGGVGTVNPYTGLKEYKGGGDDREEAPPPVDTSPIIDTPNANPQFTMAHPEFASYKNLYRMEHGLAKDAALPEGWSRTSPNDKAILYMKYNSVTPDARNAYYDYVTNLRGQTFSDEKLYNTEKRRSDIMQGLIPKADTAYFGSKAINFVGGNPTVPSYSGPTYGGPAYGDAHKYVTNMAEGGQVKSDDMNNYQNMAALGRGGDTELAYTGAREREMLRQMGGSGTVNPYTGLKEYKGGATRRAEAASEPVYQTYAIDTSLDSARPISDLQTEGQYDAPTLRTVSLTDDLAPSGMGPLSSLMRRYGVSTPAAVGYLGTEEPEAPGEFSATAPTPLSGLVTQAQIDEYNAARNAYNSNVANYNTSIDTYNTNFNKYGLDKARYDQYITEYNRRMQQPINLYAQEQFGYKDELPTASDILLAPTYAEGGEVDAEPGLDETELGLEEMYQQYAGSNNSAAIAQRRQAYQAETDAFNKMLESSLSSPDDNELGLEETYQQYAGSNNSAAIAQRRQAYQDETDAFNKMLESSLSSPDDNELGLEETYQQYAGSNNSAAIAQRRQAYQDETDAFNKMLESSLSSPDDNELGLEEMYQQYAGSNNSAAIAQRRQAYQDETDAFNKMLESSLSSPDDKRLSQAEMFFRLAAAFGQPTKTKQGFMENLGTAAGQMAEYAQNQYSRSREDLKTRLAAQKLKQEGAKNALTMEIAAGKPLSSAGKIASDMGYKPGTPEYVAKVDEIAQRQADYQNALIAGSQAGVRQKERQAVQLTPTEMKYKDDAQDLIGKADDAMSLLKQAYALNPKTLGSTWGEKGWQIVGSNVNPNDPRIQNTRIVNNLLREKAIASLKATFGAQFTKAEGDLLMELQGVDSMSPQERKRLMLKAYGLVKERRARAQRKLDDITSGKFRMIETQEGE